MRLALLSILGLLLGCNAAQQAPAELPPDHPRRLVHAFDAFLAQQQKTPSPEAAQAFMEGFALTQEQLIRLFGPERGARLWPAYRDTVFGAVKAEAGTVLVREITQNGRTEPWVEKIGPAWPAATTKGDLKLLDNMVAKRPMYTVRLRKPGEQLGLRLNGFIYIDGGFKALLKSYDHL